LLALIVMAAMQTATAAKISNCLIVGSRSRLAAIVASPLP
jgi:hypothetical protein